MPTQCTPSLFHSFCHCQVGLLVIDEIHLLGADRGPILEVIVSRMRYIAAQVRHRQAPGTAGGLRGRGPSRQGAAAPAALGGRLTPTRSLLSPPLSPTPADRAQYPVCGAVHGASKCAGPGRLAGHHWAGEQPVARLALCLTHQRPSWEPPALAPKKHAASQCAVAHLPPSHLSPPAGPVQLQAQRAARAPGVPHPGKLSASELVWFLPVQ